MPRTGENQTQTYYEIVLNVKSITKNKTIRIYEKVT